MKKLLTTLFAGICTTAAFADATPAQDTQQMGYVGIGVGALPNLLPTFSGGYRMQSGHWGIDLPLQVTTAGAPFTMASASVIGHYYPAPNVKSEMYLGLGASAGIAFSSGNSWYPKESVWPSKWSRHDWTVSPVAVIGHQYHTAGGQKRFVEAQVKVPTYAFDTEKTIDIPLVTVSYGFGF